ncbi:MAG: Gfo/Idh/MocA family oxidoreductase [Verrucomicrobiales bacterium]|nr:Gfo/Idh/MocA family oxidoreductase [Verrucomicrobiales bacterium]
MKQSRRNFLSSAAGIGAGISFPSIIPASALGSGDRPAPSERITMGFIGMGNRGIGVMGAFLNHADVQGVAICDVHDHHYREREWGEGRPLGRKPGKESVDKKYGNTDCAAYSDFRELFERDDLDAVMVATPDHWHYHITMAALEKGIDVYCEKPVTHLFGEGQAVYQKVAEKNAVFSVGSQQRSEPVFRQAVEIVRNGHLGNVSRFEVGLPAGYSDAQGNTEVIDVPKGLDYNFWCGPGERLPYMKARHHRWWRWHTAYGGGNIMDWIGHHNDIAHWGMGYENSGPVRVEAKGWTWAETEVYDTPVEYEVHSDFADGKKGIISTGFRKGTKWIGENGWVWVDRGQIETSNPEWLAKDFNAGDWKAYRSPGHQRNFIDCVKNRKETAAPAENGHRSITPGHLGWVSARLGRALKWDPAAEKIQGDDAAQEALMKMDYRDWG